MTSGFRGSRRWIPWIAAALISALLAFPLQGYLTRFPRGLLTDDAYFYVKIAWYLGTHGVSSFDGIHITDGYHLVWEGLLGAVSGWVGLFTRVPWVHLGAMLWLYFMICWAIGLRFGRGWKEVLLLFSLGIVFKTMMETTLLSLLLLLLCDREYLSEASFRNNPRWRWRPLVLVLLPLVRLDAALIGGVMAFAFLFPFPRAEGKEGKKTGSKVLGLQWKPVAADWGWIALGALLQLAVHFALFRDWSSVSMQLKGLGGFTLAERLSHNFSGFYGANLVSVVIFVLFWTLAIHVALRRPKPERARHFMVVAAPAVFVIFHMVFNNTIDYWYFLPAVYVHVWYFLRFGPSARSRTGGLGRAVMALLIVLFVFKWAFDTRVRAPEIQWSRQFVQEVKREVPPGEPVYQIDASGWVGWFSERNVVDGDGLVNDHAYVRRLLGGKLAGYLREERIHYIVQNVYPRDGLLIDQGGLIVPMDSVETLIPPPDGFPSLTAFGLYRLK